MSVFKENPSPTICLYTLCYRCWDSDRLVKSHLLITGSVRVGAITYSTGTDIQFYLNTYSRKADVLAAIDEIEYTYGSTNTADGLRIMRDELFSFRYVSSIPACKMQKTTVIFVQTHPFF